MTNDDKNRTVEYWNDVVFEMREWNANHSERAIRLLLDQGPICNCSILCYRGSRPNYLCYKGQTTPALDELFNGEAPRRLETAVQLLKSDNRKTLLRAVLIFMIAWAPLVLRNLILSRRWAAVIIAVLLLLPPVLLYEIPLNVIVPDLMKLLL